MPSKYLRKGPTKLKKCSERRTDSCGPETDGCCGVITCTYCLRFVTYGDTETGTAEFPEGGTGWSGSIAGSDFFSYWQRNYETSECQFVVELDGVEIYRKSCYEGQSCRDSSDSAEVTIGYESGTLSWTKFLSRPLPLIDDPDTGCRTWFCGDCHCSCQALCIDVREVVYTDFIDTYSGEISDTTYSDCEGPVWSGTVGNFTISLALGRDEYGNCIVTPTVNGEEHAAVSVIGCSDMSGTVELYDGSSFAFRCKTCDCGITIGDCICGRPLGPSVTLLWSSANGTHGNAPREFELSYGMTSAAGIVCDPYPIGGPFPAYTGSSSGTFPIPMGGTRQDTLYVMMVCCIGCPTCVYYRFQSNMDIGDSTWYLTYILTQDCNCPAILSVDNFQSANDYQISDITIFEDASNC